ncbi:MAG: osmotically-inducible protein OsmY [Saprospiraceae bacterium]|jgi:osmotically-inducible protein OsmY|tara:strand:+ start:2209 stop:2862 length:654 start_codon:yes stop_codon:yes gene_type:complete
MKSNSDLQKDVQNAIRWESTLYAEQIGVTAKSGVITLSGTVDSYSKKINAYNASKNVKGVKAVAQEITICYGNALKRSDTEIATNILEAWENNFYVPKYGIDVEVDDGWVKLQGNVSYKSQEEETQKSIEQIIGVRGLTNLIKIKSKPNDVLEKKSVQDALSRNWSINPKNVKVEVDHSNVKLTGIVYSLYQKEEAERLAWNAPGVSSVENELAVIQ